MPIGVSRVRWSLGIYSISLILLSNVVDSLNDALCGLAARHNVIARSNGIVALNKWNAHFDASNSLEHSWPWAVRLVAVIRRNTYQQCRGTIIDDNWVITNQHCFVGVNWFSVFFDEVAGFGAPHACSLDASNVVVHPDIDIALVSLRKCNLRRESPLRAACVGAQTYPYSNNMLLLGCTPDRARVHPRSLQQTIVRQVDAFPEVTGDRYLIVLGENGARNVSCWGASGSGLFDLVNGRWTLVAVHKASHATSFYKMAVNISHIQPWIGAVTQLTQTK